MVTENRYAPANTRNRLSLLAEKPEDLSMNRPGRAAARKSMVALINNSQICFCNKIAKMLRKFELE